MPSVRYLDTVSKTNDNQKHIIPPGITDTNVLHLKTSQQIPLKCCFRETEKNTFKVLKWFTRNNFKTKRHS